ncbi:unnamed protein product [Phaeothamnion confervicola]
MQDRPMSRQTDRLPAAPAPAPTQRRSSLTEPSQVETRLAEVFVAFASSVARASSDIDSARFFKLCKDSGLVDGRLTRTDCDLIFTKALARAGGAAKRMAFGVFRHTAVPMIAAHKGSPEALVCEQIASTEGIEMSGTFAQPTRFHDDRGTYTGVHTAGGPSHTDNRITLSNLADRSGADVRGVKSGDMQPDRHFGAGAAALTAARPLSRVSGAAARRRSSGASSTGMPGLTTGDSRRGSAASGDGGLGGRKPSFGTSGGGGAGGATIAGSANRKGGVYDRLCNPDTYTGVYAERFNGGAMGGRINGDTAAYSAGRGFNGNTNSGGNYIVRDISQIVTRR